MKKNTWGLASAVMFLVLLGTEALLGFLIWKLDMVPVKYFAVLLGMFLLADALLFLLRRRRKQGKWSKAEKPLRQIVAAVLCGVLAVCCCFGAYAVMKLNQTISAVTKGTNVSAVIQVYVLQEDSAQTLEDAAGYTFGYTDTMDWKNTEETLLELQNAFGGEVNTENYLTPFAMIDALYNGEVQAIILNQSYVSILEGLEEYSDFSERVRSLHEHAVMMEPSEEKPQIDAGKVAEEPFVLYLSGSDTRSTMLDTSRSDVNILAAVNPSTKQILLVNTPRDYYVANPAGGGAMDKLTHCGNYGTQCSMDALAALYNEDIEYYAQINFTGFETLIDAIGGVTVNSETSFSAQGYYFQEGENELDGAAALAFARERYALAGGDNDRGKNQMRVITGVIQKLASGALLANYSQILDSLEGMFATNFPMEAVARLVKMQLEDMASWNIVSYAVTGYNGEETTYSTPGLYCYVMYPDEETVEHATELIDMVMAGEILPNE